MKERDHYPRKIWQALRALDRGDVSEYERLTADHDRDRVVANHEPIANSEGEED